MTGWFCYTLGLGLCHLALGLIYFQVDDEHRDQNVLFGLAHLGFFAFYAAILS